MSYQKNGYNLTHQYFNFCKNSGEAMDCKIHAFIFFLIEKWNQQKKDEIGFSKKEIMDFLGFEERNSLYGLFKKTEKLDLIKVVQKPKNQHENIKVKMLFFKN